MKGPFMFEGKKRQEEGLLFPDSLAAGRPKTARKNWVTTFPPHSGRLAVLIDVLSMLNFFFYLILCKTHLMASSENSIVFKIR